jgi:hypothetical protein
VTYAFYLILIFTLVHWVESPYSILPNSLIIRKDPAHELEAWLKSFNWGARALVQNPGKLPSYKFYSEVVEILLDLARKMGGQYQDSLMHLRDGLQFDRQFEKKIKESTMGLYLQMILMMGLTWLFIFGALGLVDVKVKGVHLFLILFWQVSGLISLPLTLRHFRHLYFSDIGKIWRMLYVLKALLRVPLPRSEIMGIAQVRELEEIKQKSLVEIVQKLKDTCQKSLRMGTSYEEDVKYLMEELRFQEKWHFELFEKRLTVIKLILLAVFFLPSYLAFIFLLLGDLMALM